MMAIMALTSLKNVDILDEYLFTTNSFAPAQIGYGGTGYEQGRKENISGTVQECL